MSKIKTGLMFSPLTQRIYWGKMNTETGVSVGNNQRDITSDFIGIMLQKFPIMTRQNITSNGEVEAVVIVATEEAANRYQYSKKMYEMLEKALESLPITGESEKRDELRVGIIDLLAKARGE